MKRRTQSTTPIRRSAGYRIVSAVLCLMALSCPSSRGSEIDQPTEKATERSRELFEKHIRPALIEHCQSCHGPEKSKGGLRLDSRDGWAEGGDSGPAIIPGDRDSLLLDAIRHGDSGFEMPPRGKLDEPTIRAFEEWIASGAADPRAKSKSMHIEESDVPTVESGRDFWAFRSPTKAPAPTAKRAQWPRNAIDSYILADLEAEGLEPAKSVDRQSLLRRLFYDLVGLPPTPDEIDRFIKDSSPNAIAKQIDRLIASPEFGQRWGRHWLDVVRYAESSGGGRSLLIPNAWRYRDYVIDAFNEDRPFDRFIVQQIAGDLLPEPNWRTRQANLIATGFLLLGPTNYEMQDKDILEMDVVDEQIDTIGKAFLGMTIGCARCHDHKFDPIPATDYYAIAGIFKSTQSLVHSNVSKWNTAGLPVTPGEEEKLDSHQKLVDELKTLHRAAKQRWARAGGRADSDSKANSIDPNQIDAIVLDDDQAELSGDWTQSTAIEGFVGEHYLHDGSELRGSKQASFRHAVESEEECQIFLSYTASSNRSRRVPVRIKHLDGETLVQVDQTAKPSVMNSFVSLGSYRVGPQQDVEVVISNSGTEDGVVIVDTIVIAAATRSTAAIFGGEPTGTQQDRDLLAKLKSKVDEFEKRIKDLEKSAPTRPTAVSVTDRSDANDIHLAIRGVAGQHGPMVPRGALQVASWQTFPQIPDGCSGRQQFAAWIADQQNPLTARVIVNRVWSWLMGRGLVESVDNFGSMGAEPTNQPLLDRMAVEFIEDDWSIKRLVRRIVNSRTYQLSTEGDPSALNGDPDNRLFGRMNRKRLRAEDIRDSILIVAGVLDHQHGGATIKPGTKTEYGYTFDLHRRSVYTPVFRNTLPEVFEVFDFADPNIQLGQRTSSTVASQALWMMNHPWIQDRCRDAAGRLLAKDLASNRERIEHAYQQVLGRRPSDAELAIALDLVGSREVRPDSPTLESTTNQSVALWATLYQALFQSIDFRFLN